MAANYKVNIELDTSKLDAQLKDLGVKVDAVGKTRAGTAKKALTAEEQLNKEIDKQLSEEIKILNTKNSTATSANKALKLNRQGAKNQKQVNQLLHIEKNLNGDNLKFQKIDKLNADYELKVQQRKLDAQVKENKISQKTIKVDNDVNKVLKERVRTLGQIIKLRQLGNRFGALGADLDALNALNTRGPGGSPLALPSSEMLEARVKSTGQRGGFAGGARGGGIGSMFSGFNRGAALSSATISGAFPLLFGQGPVSALGGAIGGGLGGGLGGQMGGFAGGLAGTTIATGIAQFTGSVANLGKALNENTKDVAALSEALGITGTEFEKNLKVLAELGGEEAAFEAARSKMINLVGQQGVDALSKFGKGTTELANQFTIAMTQMRASFASAFGNTGIGRAITGQLTKGNLLRQAKVSKDEGVVTAMTRYKQSQLPTWRRSEEFKEDPISVNAALDAVYKAQEKANVNEAKGAEEKILADIQAQRVANIDKEILLLEKGVGMTEMEFEVETKIMEIKKEGEIQDEAAIRAKLEKLYKLEEERDLTKEIEESYERMTETIVNDLGEGIKGLIRGTSTLNDVLNSVLDKMIDAALNMALYGNMAGSFSKGAGFLGAIFGRASGGPVKGGSPYVVGEKGPELFVPNSHGNIVPNNEMGGGANIVVNVDASGSSVEGDADAAQELGGMLAAAIQAELIKEKRPGGLLT